MSLPKQPPFLGAALLLGLSILTSGCEKKELQAPPDTTPTYPAPTKKAGMTWYKDVQPIVAVSCQGCHVAGGIGPFPLTSYDEARKVSGAVSSAVTARRMPPWMPHPDCQRFQNSRKLTQDQVDTIFSWNDDGAPLGDVSDARPAPAPPRGLPWVDRELDAGAQYTPAQSPVDDYRCFVLDPGLTQGQDLIGYDFVPEQRQQVHHVLVFSAAMADAKKLDGAESGLGYTCFGGPKTPSPQLVAAWVPGSGATQFPAGTGIPLAAGSALVVQVHFNTANGAPVPDRSVLKLQLARTPVGKKATIAPIVDSSFTIPQGALDYTVQPSLKLKTDVTLWGLAPHMHTLGKHIRVDVDGECMIDIPQWDFHWQQLYFYDNTDRQGSGIRIKAGARAKLSCVWDNPGGTPVEQGEGTADEMCLNYFYVTP